MEIRPAEIGDIPALARMIDQFAVGHPAEHHPRSHASIEGAYFGPDRVARLVVALRDDEPIGFAGWSRVYDMFWCCHGGAAVGLFVRRGWRGRGIAACLIASICAEIREGGGEFLRSTYEGRVASFYERIATGRLVREGHLSAEAFTLIADLEGESPRQILRSLPAVSRRVAREIE